MEYIYSAMLLHSAGKKINEANIKKILTAAGVDVDDARIKALTASLEGVDIEEAIKTSAVAHVAAAPADSGGKKSSKDKDKKKEEKKEEEEEEEEEVSEEEAAAGLGALFG
jgi:large subunit ribosomal protein L12